MCPIVSANWNNGSNAGVWTLNLNNVRTNANNNVGARADSIPYPHRQECHSGIQGGAFRRVGILLTAKSAAACFSGRFNLEGQT